MSTEDVILDTDVSEEMNSSFLEYAMSVIVARALPDVRDGLKPVHRRILYTMYDARMLPDGPFRKSARTVGAVIGRFHPHGDSAVYEAMVRLAQTWSMRLPLVDGHGNFGSLDDGPAAMRYTEARLAPSSLLLLAELAEDTVPMRPNYDGTESEPEVLPAALPNLLLNGSTGIAVGMATNMPPHNLAEVDAVLQRLLSEPGVSDDVLLGLMPGPDFPSGGLVLASNGYEEAFRTGRGSVTLRARTSVEEVRPRRMGIVVTELPYTVGPEKVIARVKELVASKRVEGVADIKDFSDRRTGMRLVIEVKSGFAPERVRDELFRLSPLQETFSISNVVLVDGEPRTLGVRRIAELFLEHRRVVVRRRSEFRLARASARAHVLEGLLLALASIDEVIALVRASRSTADARKALVERLGLSVEQADAVLEMTIRRLTGLETSKLESELKALRKDISQLQKLLASARLLDQAVASELAAAAAQFSTPRRSTLVSEMSVAAVQEEVADDPATVLLLPSGELTRPASQSDALPPHLSAVASTLRSPVGVVLSDGRVLRMPAADVPAAGTLRPSVDSGRPVPVGLVDLRPGGRVMLVTAAGAVKSFETDVFPSRGDLRPVLRLPDGDVLVAGFMLPDPASDLLLVTSDGRALRMPASSVSPKGLAAGPLAGMRMVDGSRVVAAGPAGDGVRVGMLLDSGRVKLLEAGEVPVKGRGGGGVRVVAFRKGDAALVAAAVGPDLVPVSARSTPVRLALDVSPRAASASAPSKPVSGFLRSAG